MFIFSCLDMQGTKTYVVDRLCLNAIFKSLHTNCLIFDQFCCPLINTIIICLCDLQLFTFIAATIKKLTLSCQKQMLGTFLLPRQSRKYLKAGLNYLKRPPSCKLKIKLRKLPKIISRIGKGS